MKKSSPLNHLALKDYVLRIIMLLAAIAAVTFFLPREKDFGFDFKLNKPWTHKQLIASYDFPIYKSENTLKAERDSVMKLFQPYFTEDKSIAKTQINLLRKKFEEGGMKGMTAHAMSVLVAHLNDVYSAGVVKSENMRTMNDSSITAIRVISGTEAKSRKLTAVYSTRTAYEYLINVDSTLIRPEMLASFNLNEFIEANLVYDENRSTNAKRDLLETVTTSYGLVQRGQKIIDRGEIVNNQTYNILVSLERESQERNLPAQGIGEIFFGQFMIVTLLFSFFFIYLLLFRRDYFERINSLALMLSLMVLFPVASSLIPSGSRAINFLVPIAMVGIFIRIFADTRTACLTLCGTTLLASLSMADPYEFILVNITSGLAAIYSLHDLQQRSQLLRTAFIATVVSVITAFAFDMMYGTDIRDIDITLYFYLLICGVFLLFAYPLLFVLEKTFGFISSVTLIELSNTNSPLLRRMSKEAAGTFNHSMQVANLAADVAEKIGAKKLLVRTGALYHDIGKLVNPAFFTENQKGINPHDKLPPERSAQIIISHVSEGLKLAEKFHLPKDVRAFIATHHGRSKTKYFYVTYVNSHPGEEVNEALFTYPGPNPFTREQAILMMADSIEAASRSLKEVNDESIRNLVNKMIDTQMKEGYFENCPITFKDIRTAKEVFIDNLKTIYHTRIQYPEFNDTAKAPKPDKPYNLGNLLGNRRRNR